MVAKASSQLTAGVQPGRLVRVQGDRGHHRRVPPRDVDRPLGAGDVATDLDDLRHAHRPCRVERCVDRQSGTVAVRVHHHVEVAVAVGDRHRERLRRRGVRTASRPQPVDGSEAVTPAG